MLPSHSVKAKLMTKAHKALHDLPYLSKASPTSLPTSLLFFKHARHGPTSWPLHWLLPVPALSPNINMSPFFISYKSLLKFHLLNVAYFLLPTPGNHKSYLFFSNFLCLDFTFK